jgi:V-type H+-transporting ATPase subunit a
LKKARIVPNVSSSVKSDTLDTLEPRLENWETELRDLNNRLEQLVTQRNSSLEYKMVLDKEVSFYREGSGADDMFGGKGAEKGLMDDGHTDTGPDFRSGGLRYLTGVINDDRYIMFERLVFRATRGNMFMKSEECAPNAFVDPTTGKHIQKRVFVVFFSAQRAYEKIKKAL